MVEYVVFPIHKKCIQSVSKSNNCMIIDAQSPETARNKYVQHIKFNENEVLIVIPQYNGYILHSTGDAFLINRLRKGNINKKLIRII